MSKLSWKQAFDAASKEVKQAPEWFHEVAALSERLAQQRTESLRGGK